jgi:DNA-binding protein H-NS
MCEELQLIEIAEKYKKVMAQRSNATKAWIKRNRERVNEYNKQYQKKIYAEKKAKQCIAPKEKVISYNDPEKYKQYQAAYRATKLLRRLPFFEVEIFQ